MLSYLSVLLSTSGLKAPPRGLYLAEVPGPVGSINRQLRRHFEPCSSSVLHSLTCLDFLSLPFAVAFRQTLAEHELVETAGSQSAGL